MASNTFIIISRRSLYQQINVRYRPLWWCVNRPEADLLKSWKSTILSLQHKSLLNFYYYLLWYKNVPLASDIEPKLVEREARYRRSEHHIRIIVWFCPFKQFHTRHLQLVLLINMMELLSAIAKLTITASNYLNTHVRAAAASNGPPHCLLPPNHCRPSGGPLSVRRDAEERARTPQHLHLNVM